MARIPPPRSTLDAPLRALIFDSYYDPYRGVVCQFRVMDGTVRKGDTVVMMNTGEALRAFSCCAFTWFCVSVLGLFVFWEGGTLPS